MITLRKSKIDITTFAYCKALNMLPRMLCAEEEKGELVSHDNMSELKYMIFKIKSTIILTRQYLCGFG